MFDKSLLVQNTLEYALVTGAIGSLIASLIAALIVETVKYFQTRRAQLTGIWYGEIFEHGTLIKKDEYHVKHRGIKLNVTGKRIFPYDQTDRQWYFHGIFKDRIVTGYYNAINPLLDSFGCILLKADADCKVLEGYYMTLKKGNIDYVTYKWRRK